ncbi:MAG: DinB family protein [Gemmatimonadetes bacterium]|nr:DinB family protein [Gemmatimonadota bacterium]
MNRPQPHEHDEYYSLYIDRVPDRPIADVLGEAPAALEELLASLRPEHETWAYAPDKWSIRELLGHVIDSERVFSYRALHMARGDTADLPGMDQDVWAGASNAGDRPVADLLAEFRGLRAANTRLFTSFDDEISSRTGVASGYAFTVRALVFIIAGHEIHHRDVLRDRYLAALPEEATTHG